MHVSRTDQAGVVRLHVSGEIDIAASAELMAEAIHQLKGRDLILDLRQVSFLDSSGLSALVRIRNEMEALKSTLLIADPSPTVVKLFELTGLDSVFTVADTSVRSEDSSSSG